MKKLKIHLWVGNFENKELLKDFVKDITRGENNKKPISKFAESQSEWRIDHDFLEISFKDNEKPIQEKFLGSSYSKFWIAEAGNRIHEKDPKKINALIMLFLDKDRDPIKTPKPFNGKGYEMEYLGIIEFDCTPDELF